jgi:hypothetical protein
MVGDGMEQGLKMKQDKEEKQILDSLESGTQTVKSGN